VALGPVKARRAPEGPRFLKRVAIWQEPANVLLRVFVNPKVFDMQANQPSLGKITFVYIGYYLVIAILLNLVLWALERFGGFVIEGNALSWLPLILGAMFAGQYYGTKAGAKPPQSFSWMAGLLFMVVSVILSVGLLYALALVAGLDVGAAIDEMLAHAGDDVGLIAGIIGGLLLLIWVAQRFMFSAGAAGAVKQAARLAAKGK
jgi:hypothetical protein